MTVKVHINAKVYEAFLDGMAVEVVKSPSAGLTIEIIADTEEILIYKEGRSRMGTVMVKIK